jgi:hypothetical protein
MPYCPDDYVYEYILRYSTGDIIAGEWAYPEQAAARPDYVWRPSSPKPPPSPINPNKVREIVN